MISIGWLVIFKKHEVADLLRYSKIDKAFKAKGISVEDILSNRYHLRRRPVRKERRDV